MEETKSNWSCVMDEMIQKVEPVELGEQSSSWFYNKQSHILHFLSYYKFASKLIGKEKRVLDVSCSEGLGSYILGKECGFAQGLDQDQEAIRSAQSNFSEDFIKFDSLDFLKMSGKPEWDAIIHLGMTDPILPETGDALLEVTCLNLKPEALTIVCTPSQIANEFNSIALEKGQERFYYHESLEETMKRFFEFVFLFAVNDEVIHTGLMPLARYYIAVGCKKR